MSRDRIYIAGPMRGYPDHNVPAFEAAANRLRDLGFDVVSPVEVGKAWASDVDQSVHPPEAWVRRDLQALTTCEAITLLEGWEASTGARCEATVAVTLGFRFFDLDGHLVTPPSRIVIQGGYDRAPGTGESLDGLFEEVRAWQRATFPAATRRSVAMHLHEEAAELLADPDDDEEVADVAMLLAGMMGGEQLVNAVRRKLEQCKLRTWGEPDADGVVRHVREVAS